MEVLLIHMITWIMRRIYDDGNRAREGDVLEALIKQLKYLDTMTGPDLAYTLSDLPIQQAGTMSGMSMAKAIAVTFCKL